MDLELQPSDVAARLAAGELQLVDVREQSEYDTGHVPGSIHLPMNEVTARAGEIDKDRPVAFICLMGARSEMVTEYFRPGATTLTTSPADSPGGSTSGSRPSPTKRGSPGTEVSRIVLA